MILSVHTRGDKKDCNNYRRIIFLSGVKMIHTGIGWKHTNHNRYCFVEAQGSFQKSRNPEDHIFSIKEIIK